MPGEAEGRARAGGEMSSELDYYELLEVERSADAGTIKSAYRTLAKECRSHEPAFRNSIGS